MVSTVACWRLRGNKGNGKRLKLRRSIKEGEKCLSYQKLDRCHSMPLKAPVVRMELRPPRIH